MLTCSLLAGCGGTAGYDTMLASGENDPSDDHHATLRSDNAASAGVTPAADTSSPPPSVSGSSEPHQPFWSNAELPEVVPYAMEEEEEEEEEEDNRAPAPPLPSNFFVNDQPKAPAPSPAPTPSFTPAISSQPAPAPPASTVASGGSTPSMPVDPRPGSTPGRPNPFGFPSGFGGHNHGGSSPPPSNSVASASSTVPKVRLSSALALAQSLPTGTAMGFSMDYVFLSDFVPNARYAWIIQPPRGNAVAMEVRLQQQGSLSHFVTQWGPIEGNYKLQLVILDSKGKPHPMSRAIDAFYAY